MTEEEKIICKQFLNDADKTHSCNEYKLLMALLEQEPNCSEIPTGSTTKNCESCKYYGSQHEVCNYCYKCSLWTEKEPTTKNNLVVDCVSRQAVDRLVWKCLRHETDETIAFYEHFLDLPSVTPQEPKSFKWCTDCKEYNQEKHCCHRYSKVIRDTVAEIEQEPRWISCSERLPENRDFYLVSTTDCITIMEFINGWISQNIGLCNWYVKAWMPLPKAYKAESEDK